MSGEGVDAGGALGVILYIILWGVHHGMVRLWDGFTAVAAASTVTVGSQVVKMYTCAPPGATLGMCDAIAAPATGDVNCVKIRSMV